ncbi:MAG: aminoglycoside phosphotransferase family protein [Pusillimonas sp.]
MTNSPQQPDPRLVQFMRDQKLASADESGAWTALTGGVSSDIWRVDLRKGSFCVKCALPKLKVARDWQAPTIRNTYEWEWLNFAYRQMPAVVPRPIAHDGAMEAFVMAFLDGAHYPVWKQLLLDGVIQEKTAADVGQALVALHAASARDPGLPGRFKTDDIFYSIRLEPYLVATAQAHPELAAPLNRLVQQTLNRHVALVHGDVSPKNILVGPNSPVFLDAECAWFGDPAFDVAFCLNHFLLKSVARPAWRGALMSLFDVFSRRYLTGVDWEAPADLERRAAALLPALFLARVDGKSPVEYLQTEAERDTVRQFARPLILTPPATLAAVSSAWSAAVA